MPKEEKNFKRQVRARMKRTGEAYTTARAHLDTNKPASEPATDAPSGSDEYLYVETRTGGAQEFGGRTPEERDWFSHESIDRQWICPEGFGRTTRRPQPVSRWITPGAAERWAAFAAARARRGRPFPPWAPNPMGPHDRPAGPSAFSYPGSLKLPSDPQALLRTMGERLAVNSRLAARRLFKMVGDIQAGARPELRDAAYHLVEGWPGVEPLGEVPDDLERPGVGFAFDDSEEGQQVQMIFDSSTRALLEQRAIQVGRNNRSRWAREMVLERHQQSRAQRGLPPAEVSPGFWDDADPPRGCVAHYTAYVTTGFVGSMFVTPAGETVPYSRFERSLPDGTPWPRTTDPFDPGVIPIRTPPEVALPQDPDSLSGRFQMRCRELIGEIRELGHEPRGWVTVLNGLGALRGTRYLFDLQYLLPATTWLIERGKPELTLEHEVLEPQWAELFSEAERATAAQRLRSS